MTSYDDSYALADIDTTSCGPDAGVVVSDEYRAKIEDMVESGYIRNGQCDVGLSIYNYTQKTQYEQNWNDQTRVCRGLVLDESGKIIIKPPQKFFNVGEPNAAKIDVQNAIISEKLDGYYIAIKWDPTYGLVVTSRGSFDNKYTEAAKAFITEEVEELLKKKMNHTFFCELLQDFPGDESIIVTKHGDPKLVCWAYMDDKYHELPPNENGIFLSAKQFSTYPEAKKYLEQQVEGVVARDRKTNSRVKIKTEWFIKMHRLISDCTKRRVWELLKSDARVEELDIPDELYGQMADWQDELLAKFIDKRTDIDCWAARVYAQKWTKKEIALSEEIPKEYKPVIFNLLKGDKKRADEQIWDWLKPKYK